MTDRTDWLAWRSKGIGASDVAGILGLSPWSSPWKVWADKVGLLPEEPDNERFEFGRRAEPLLAEWFADEASLYVAGEQMRCENPEHPWMRCTLDGLAMEGPGDASIDDAVAAVEWKTTSQAPWDDVPTHYQCQATWTSLVTGLDVVWFGVLHMAFGRPSFRTYEFMPDAEDKRTVAETVTRFWEDHVLAGTPPSADGSSATTEAIAAAWPEHQAEAAVDIDPLDLELRAGLKAQVKEIESDVRTAENRLRAALGDAELGLVDGQPALTYRSQTRTTTCKECGHETTSKPFRVLRPTTRR